MTREEAIEFIAQSVKSDVDIALVADAIKALEQEPTTKNCRTCKNFGSHHGICEICKDNRCWAGQEPQSFKWCTDCKEYDQEKHCCHRYSKVIRDTVSGIEQEPFINKPCVSEKVCEHDKQMVLDKLKAEIEEPLKINQGLNTESAKAQAIALSWVLEVIDKYKAEIEPQKSEDI